MKKRIAVFPILPNTISLIETHNRINSKAEIVCCYTFPAYGYLLEEKMWGDENWDELVVWGDMISDEKNDINYVLKIISKAYEKGCPITICNSSEKLRTAIAKKCPDSCHNKIYYRFSQEDEVRKRAIGTLDYSKVELPVIFVGGLVKSYNLLGMSLRIKEYAENRKGYKASVLTKTFLGDIDGIYSYGDILQLADSGTINDIVYKLNKFARQVIAKDQPDVLIVELPNEMMKYSDEVVGNFGIETKVFCEALSPNCLMLDVPYQYAEPLFIKKVEEYFERAYELKISTINVNNLWIDGMSTLQNREISLLQRDKVDIAAYASMLNKMTGIAVEIYPFKDSNLGFDNIIKDCKIEIKEKEHNDILVDVDDKVLQIISQMISPERKVLPGVITSENLLGNEIGLTAIDLVYILFELEKAYGIRIKSIDLEPYGFCSYRNICDIVKRYV